MAKPTHLGVVCLLLSLSLKAEDFPKYTFEGGGGLSVPSGAAADRFNTGWNLLFGGGYRFTKNFSGLLEYQVDRFSLTNAVLQNANQPDGFNTYWGFTLNPRYDFNPHGRFGGYATAGYGIYHRRLAFTDPSQAVGYCDPFSGYCSSSGAPVVADFTNFKGGYNAGGGVTYALGDSGMKVFTDVRYNRFMAHTANDWVNVTFGIRF
ncbi:outer membrane beta-barrel protein [uncultured Paludibaculum sp.]|uniref:outer membrane protein n=1 Tax=uncultured Paludibaculum sp. TaxID=1765020 RepID=UPI002AABC4B5|nr:outer membrane beta-barrel protein [uncultured Paludibaculum sp.]